MLDGISKKKIIYSEQKISRHSNIENKIRSSTAKKCSDDWEWEPSRVKKGRKSDKEKGVTGG